MNLIGHSPLHPIPPEELFVRHLQELKVVAHGETGAYEAVQASKALRMLLLDESRLLDVLRRKSKQKLRFLDPRSVLLSGPAGELLWRTNVDPSLASLSEDEFVFTLEQFLKVELKLANETYPVRDVIRYTTHKAGGVHFAPAHSNHIPKDHLVPLLVVISRAVFLSLREMRDSLTALPHDIQALAHYSYKNQQVSFAGDVPSQLTSDLRSEISAGWDLARGWSWNALILVPKPVATSRPIYQLGDRRHQPLLTICAEGSSLSATLRTAVAGPGELIPMSQPFYLRVAVDSPGHKLAIFVNNRLLSEATLRLLDDAVAMTQSLGANLSGNVGASFVLSELLITAHTLSDQQSTALAKYFQWKLLDMRTKPGISVQDFNRILGGN